jgi:nitrogenase iron protein NifH
MESKIRQIAFYGKGGIGKSTIASNLAAAYAEHGLNTMMIGCDPKSDCTKNLCGEVEIPTILDVSRDKGIERVGLEELVEGKKIELDEVLYKGYNNVYCSECGGPRPGFGCAGRGVIVAIEFANKGGSPLGGIIYNVRGMLDDEDVVQDFAKKIGSQVIGHIPNAYQIAEAEIGGNTVIEYAPDSDIANLFRKLALRVYTNTSTSVPTPLPPNEMRRIGQLIRKRTKEKYKHGGEI